MNNKKEKGLFISLEGIESTGKSLIATRLKGELEEFHGKKVLVTREPGGVKAAEEIRDAIFDNEIDDRTELFLFLAARREHLRKKIIPGLFENDIVICDRYAHSTFAYQGYGKGLSIPDIYNLNQYMTDGVLPDITFVIDVPVEESIERNSRVEEQNRLDHMSTQFYESVRRGYLDMSQDNQYGYMKILDGRKSIAELVEDITEEMDIYEFAQECYAMVNIPKEVSTANIIDFDKK